MADPALVISLAAEFVGKPAFKQADSATQKLGKNVKQLAKTFGVAFSATAVLAYGKAAIKAAAADEKAQQQLALALKNVGLGRDAASSEAYIQRLQTEFGILDDDLRPAYQTLAVATRSTTESQKLLNLALDISASTGKDLGSVTGALSKAFLGNNTALSKLGVGISKADLKTGKFEDIVAQLATTFAGSATKAADTFQGSMNKLSVASSNAQEIIGTGLIDALKGLGNDDSVDNLAKAMQDTAIYIADVIRGIGQLTSALAGLPGIDKLEVGMIPIIGSFLEIFRAAGKATGAGKSGVEAQAAADLARLQGAYAQYILKTEKKITKEENDQLKAKRLQLAIDKANLALGKGSDVFNIEKIQLAAAEKNAAEQLGKITSQAQLLQITNDLARLEVKKSILDLEAAIESKDVTAITNATNKLNADLLVLGALTGQSVKLTEIKGILEAILPKDLINLGNLDSAIAKLMLIASFGTGKGAGNGPGSGSPILGDPNASPLGVPSVTMPSIFAAGGRIDSAGGYNPFNPAMVGMTSAGQRPNVVVNVSAGTIADPNSLVTLVKTAIQDLNRAGDSTTFAGAIA